MVDKEQDILIAKMGWDGKPSGEIGSRPLTAMDGAGTGGGGGKGRLEVRKARADAREKIQRSDRAKTRGRDGLSGRGNSLSQDVQVPKGSRERQAVRRRMPWINPFVRALTKVEREGEPKARCQ